MRTVGPAKRRLVKAVPLAGQLRAPARVYGYLDGGVAQGPASVLYRGRHWDIDPATVSVPSGNKKNLLKIFLKTQGYCHFCGDEIDFEKYGRANDPSDRWEVDHVIHRADGGSSDPDNYLPACLRCNRLRSSKSGDSLRHALLMGLIANDEAYEKPRSATGRALRELRINRLAANLVKRLPKSQRPAKADLETLKLNLKRFEDRVQQVRNTELSRLQAERTERKANRVPGENKPKRASFSWTKALGKVRSDPDTPPEELKADEILQQYSSDLNP